MCRYKNFVKPRSDVLAIVCALSRFVPSLIDRPRCKADLGKRALMDRVRHNTGDELLLLRLALA